MHAHVCHAHGLYTERRCPHPDHNRRRTWKNRTLGRNSANWGKVKRTVLARDHHLCQLRFAGCMGRATTVDLVAGGDHATARPDDCVAACLRCHGKKDGGKR